MVNLADRLEELAEADAPPMQIDIARALESGRRQRLRRRATLTSGVAAVTVAGVLVTSSMVGSVGRSEAPAAPTTQPAPAPLTTYATFGWLPDEITRIDFAKGYHGDHAHATNENADLGVHMWLTVHPAGAVPKPGLFRNRKYVLIPARPVEGRTAYWASEKGSDPLNGGDAVLLWLAADGHWVELHAYYLDSFDDPEAVLHRVATDVKVAEQAQALPVAVTGLPAKYRTYEAVLYRPMARDQGTGAWDLILIYGVNGDLGKHAFTILVNPAGTRKKTQETAQLTCKVAERVDVCVSGPEYNDREAVKELGGPKGVLDHFTPLGMNESDWRAR